MTTERFTAWPLLAVLLLMAANVLLLVFTVGGAL